MKTKVAVTTLLLLAFAAAPGVFVGLLLLAAIWTGIGFIFTFARSDVF